MENEAKKVNPGAKPACPICFLLGADLYTEKNGRLLYRCRGCRLIFMHPVPADVSEIYSEDYFGGARKGFGYVDYDADKIPMIPTFERYLGLIEDRRPGKGRLLDVGAATGFFMQIAEKRGWRTSGVEISPHATAVGVRKGLHIETGTLSALDLPKGSFDAITMFDVIEHFTDPLAEVAAAARLLKPGGLLVVNTPDAGSVWARLLGRRWHLLVPPEHIHYFTADNLGRVLRANGFSVDLRTKIGKRFTLPYVFKMLYSWQGWPLWRRIYESSKGSRIGSLSMPIDLRDNLFMIAVKA
ncbi:MAG: class I SAM-dependent methyltransferase [Minisyncoccia bacterium]|jgi:SAM-dependent methyltransferase